MKKIGVLFAGQGAQTTGMGLSVLQETPSLLPYFDTIASQLQFPLRDMLLSTDGRLNQTQYTQPAMLATSLLLYQQLKTLLPFSAVAMAGFSLGEYTALHASKIISLHGILKLIQIRAQAMHQAATDAPGAMAAILGMDEQVLIALCKQVSTASASVIVANYNCPGQLVISGHREAVNQVVALAPTQGARRAIMLNVSGAFHTPIMQAAQSALLTVLPSIHFSASPIALYSNVDAKPMRLDTIIHTIAKQVVSPVYFERSIRNMIQDGIQAFIEIGPGNVLSGFVKKIDPMIPVSAFNGLSDLEKIKEIL
jgi:[acyl-carrier-protein] S-malonyltransferase